MLQFTYQLGLSIATRKKHGSARISLGFVQKIMCAFNLEIRQGTQKTGTQNAGLKKAGTNVTSGRI